jgi:hypothetical protein
MPPLTEVPARVHGDPCFAPAHVLSREIAARRLSPVDLMDAFLGRIAAHDPKLHAFVEVYASKARLASQAAEQAIHAGHALGPFHGSAARCGRPRPAIPRQLVVEAHPRARYQLRMH